MYGLHHEEIPVAVRQVIRWVAIVFLSGWLGMGVAFADSEGGTPAGGTPGALSDSEMASFGCLTGGSGLFAAGYLAGPSETMMLWGGGLLVPSGSTVLAISLLGALGAAGCSIGATLAPTVVWISEQWDRLLTHLVSTTK
jgi:hypothetical protein